MSDPSYLSDGETEWTLSSLVYASSIGVALYVIVVDLWAPRIHLLSWSS